MATTLYARGIHHSGFHAALSAAALRDDSVAVLLNNEKQLLDPPRGTSVCPSVTANLQKNRAPQLLGDIQKEMQLPGIPDGYSKSMD